MKMMEKFIDVFDKEFAKILSEGDIKCLILDENVPEISQIQEEREKWIFEESGLKCSYCKVEFKDVKSQREHYKLNWHKYNLKLSLLKKSSITEDEFLNLNEKVDNLNISSSEEEEESINTFITHQGKLILHNEKHYFSVWRCLIFNKKQEFDPQKISESLKFTCTENKKWTILMLSGGHFAGAIFNENQPLVHKTFHCYTVRQGQGGSQTSRDNKSATSHPKSAGASLRRYNEQALIQHVRGILEQWSLDIQTSSLIFIRAPGSYNRSVLFGGNPPILSKTDTRVRSIPFSTTRPKFTELQRVHAKLKIVQMFENPEAAHSLFKKEAADLKVKKKSPNKVLNRANSRESINRSLPCSEHSEQSDELSIDDNLEYSDHEISFDNLEEYQCTDVPKVSPKKKSRKRVRNKKDEDSGKVREIFDVLRSNDLEKFKGYFGIMEEGFVNKTFDESGNSFLHVAAMNDSVDIVQFLLENGADPCLKNKNLQTPFVCTANKEVKEVMKEFAKKNPELFNYNKANIPIPSISEEEKAERKKAMKKIKREKEKEKKKINQIQSLEDEEKIRFLALTDNEKIKFFSQNHPNFQNTCRCFSCGNDIKKTIPFGYLLYKFCSVECLKAHRSK